jgi:hypothetical protein
MTIDEMYNQMKDHFSRPGAVLSKSPPESGGMGYYRLDRDPLSPARCAVGCLIPDDKYNSDWEGLNVLDAMDESNIGEILGVSKKDAKSVSFLMAAQRQHDTHTSTSTTSFLEGLENVYDKFRD